MPAGPGTLAFVVPARASMVVAVLAAVVLSLVVSRLDRRRRADRPRAAPRSGAARAPREPRRVGRVRTRSRHRRDRVLAQRVAVAPPRVEREARGDVRSADCARARRSRSRPTSSETVSRSDTTWQGNLVLKGYGDPTLVVRRSHGAGEAGARVGHHACDGTHLADESWFDSRRTAPGWKAAFYIDESPPLSASDRRSRPSSDASRRTIPRSRQVSSSARRSSVPACRRRRHGARRRRRHGAAARRRRLAAARPRSCAGWTA